MEKKKIQSIEPNIADMANGWLKSYKLDYKLEQESLNAEIDKALADMHLKNFSLYSVRKGNYYLTPAYDMVSTALVMPEDTEELALTLNGKKRKIRRSDFEVAMSGSGLEAKIIEKMFAKFEKASGKWLEFVNISFLLNDMKVLYKQIVADKLNTLK